MVLVDTSVWIRFVAGHRTYSSELDQLLANDEVLGHDLVYGELLIGDRGGRRALLSAYAQIHQAASVPHAEVIELVRRRELHGAGIGWIDACLLASALVEGSTLWTADSTLAALAGELGIGHTPSSAS